MTFSDFMVFYVIFDGTTGYVGVPNALQFGDWIHFHVFPQERLWAHDPTPLWGIEKANLCFS